MTTNELKLYVGKKVIAHVLSCTGKIRIIQGVFGIFDNGRTCAIGRSCMHGNRAMMPMDIQSIAIN